MHKLDKLRQLGNIINFEYSENFPNSGFTSLIFPIRKAQGPLHKIAKKIPAPIPYVFIRITTSCCSILLSASGEPGLLVGILPQI